MSVKRLGVAAFTGGVDGNAGHDACNIGCNVAAFTGGVDGNTLSMLPSLRLNVAAFTGGVDGNTASRDVNGELTSPPSRAAWIEIKRRHGFYGGIRVAAFTGGVDGNLEMSSFSIMSVKSPPSRAAWIEIEQTELPF